MKTLAARLFAIASVLLLVACSQGKPASPPPSGITVEPRDASVIVTWAQDPSIEYWLFFAASSGLSSKTATTLPGGRIVPSVGSPVVVRALLNDTTYFFTMNGRTNGGPGGPDAPVVSATPRAAGSVWTVGTPIGTTDLHGVARGNEVVTVGAGGAIFFSPDGKAWKPVPFVVASDLNAVVANISPSFYVAAGAAGSLLTSGDAQTWQTQTTGTSSNLRGLAATSAGFVVGVGESGTIITSLGAITWNKPSSGTTENLNAVAFGNGIIVAVGANGVILTSVDAITWTPAVSGTAAALNGVTFGLGQNGLPTTALAQFVAVGAGGTVLTSLDGKTWAVETSGTASNLNAITVGSQFVAVGSGGTVITSPDGKTWTPRTSGTGNDLKAIAGGLFSESPGYSAVGAAGTNLLSL